MSVDGLETSLKQPILTVSVAAYNVEKFIERCLCSCVGFDGMLDVIVVDDGSTDETGKIADEFVKKYPDVFRVVHKENGHYGSTINASLPIARGKYYRLLDSDDWFDSKGMHQWLNVLLGTNVDAAITASIRTTEQDKDRIVDPFFETPDGDYLIEECASTRIPGSGMSNLAFRTEFLRATNLKCIEHCNYTDNEFRIVPWCHVRSVRIDHIPVYKFVKEREGQSTSLEGYRASAYDCERLFFHTAGQADFGHANSRTRAQEMAFNSLTDLAEACYRIMLLLAPSPKVKKRLIGYDRLLKNTYPEIYSGTNGSRAIRLLRTTNFLAYTALARRAAQKWEQA